MSTYARLVNGYALDCQIVAMATDIATRFHPDWLANNPFVLVPDGTVHGAKDSGDGTFSNPAPVAVVPIAMVISASVFQDICETGLGSSARFGAVIRAMETSANDQIFSAYQRFSKSITFDKSKAAPLFSLLVGNGIMTAQERTAILNAWPMV